MEKVFDRMGIHDVVASEVGLPFCRMTPYCRSFLDSSLRLVAFHVISL
jgi:hypothetical protein